MFKMVFGLQHVHTMYLLKEKHITVQYFEFHNILGIQLVLLFNNGLMVVQKATNLWIKENGQ